MNANEKIYIKFFGCETHEDDFKNGESPEPSSFWSMNDIHFQYLHDGYSSVENALEAVCEANVFKFNKVNWISFGKEYGEDFDRFDGDVLVDENNCEASQNEIETWKSGNKKLWNCHIIVRLEVRSVRKLTVDEANAF